MWKNNDTMFAYNGDNKGHRDGKDRKNEKHCSFEHARDTLNNAQTIYELYCLQLY